MRDERTVNMDVESSFDINKVSFENVSKDFEKKFRERYKNSLNMMAQSEDRLTNSSGASSLVMLEKMARQIRNYDQSDDFEESYSDLLKEYEPYTET